MLGRYKQVCAAEMEQFLTGFPGNVYDTSSMRKR